MGPHAARATTTIGPRRADGGFTLLELLAGLLVLGFIVVGLQRSMSFGLSAWHAQARFDAGWSEQDSVTRTLIHLIEDMDPGTSDSEAQITAGAHALAFATEMSIPGTATPFHADVALSVDRTHHLVLRWTPHPHRLPIARPPPPRETMLLDGVERIDIGYVARPGTNRTWVSDLPAGETPELVRVRIVFARGDLRHWAEIVAAPRRDRPQS